MEKQFENNEILYLDEICLLVLCGPALSGKSYFAKQWFRDTEIVSLERSLQMLSARNADHTSRDAAVSLLLSIVEHRLKCNRFTVVDARCLEAALRQNLIRIARRYQIPVYLLIMDTPLSICHQRNRNSNIEPLQIEIQFHQTQSISNIATQEGFSHIFSASKFVGNKGLMPLRKTLPIRRKHCSSCDIIGDIHGCFEELQQLLHLLGYRHTSEYDCYNHPADRKAIFLGDIVDRGPNSTAVIDLVIAMVKQNQAIYLPGNHCDKFVRYLQGNNVMINHGLENTLENLKIYDAKAREYLSQQFIEMYEQAPPYLMLDNDKLLVSHAGLPEAFHGRLSNKIRSFALYGDVTGKIDECGRPMRRDWAKEYRGKTLVVYGHTPTLYPRFVNNTINIDQGCVFGGSLSALRYPERELVSIPAKYIYWQPQAQHSQSP